MSGINWLVYGDLPHGGWSVQVIEGDPEIGDEVTCVETGQRLRMASFVGLIDSASYRRGVRVIDLESEDGAPVELQPGWHLVSRTASG